MNTKVKSLFRCIAIVLCICIVGNLSYSASPKVQAQSMNSNAKAVKGMGIYTRGNNIKEKKYYDGIPYNVTVNGNYTTKIETTIKNEKATLNYFGNGKGTIVHQQSGKSITYDLKINKLIKNDIDIEIYQNNKLIDRYTSINQLDNVSYTGQVAIPIGYYLVSLVISMLIAAGVISVINSVMIREGKEWYDAKESIAIITADDTLKGCVYPALRVNNVVLIAVYEPYNIDSSEIKSILASELCDTYTYVQGTAASVLKTNGYTLESAFPDPAHTSNGSGLYFKHFHKIQHKSYQSDFHSFFGQPFVVK
ncbi:hypothetical protein acsn021_11100 [Anaerocolumna cellulosilytica]|uniref:Uncharacterized protein n=1 Tax=Anaerocolumna cellulosilytica TaxID=433286 RepID=A0A6S6R307_9FIRM|nr:hypothetical protein [Anaerocolumna cellulosilytica]MBB5194597.1 hypothetical protein [Anaerocolumna cellulosilytica]BCJ93541.1 hypothetical protein acsn021_11100 [Anaerocolumna cellulosilytica]